MKLGLDIGGSTIRATILSDSGELVDSYTFNLPANLSSSKDSLENLKNAIFSLGFSKYDLIACGMAGGFQQLFVNRVKEVLKVFSSNVFVFPDVVVSHFAFFEGGDGIVVIAGTGSSNFGKKGNKEILLGGLGYALSDVGSGFFIGKEYMSLALYNLQLGIRSREVELLIETFKEENPHRIIEYVYEKNPVHVISQFSKVVIEKDPESKIIEKAATLLAEETLKLSNFLHFEQTLPLGLTSGVFEHSSFFREIYLKTLSRHFYVEEKKAKFLNTIAAIRLAEVKNGK